MGNSGIINSFMEGDYVGVAQENEFREAFNAAFRDDPLRLFVEMDIKAYRSSDSGIYKGDFDISASISPRNKTILFEVEQYFGDTLQQSSYTHWNSYNEIKPQCPYLKSKYELLYIDYSDFIDDPNFIDSIMNLLQSAVKEHLSSLFSNLYVQDTEGEEFKIGLGATTRRYGYAFDSVNVIYELN